MPCYDPRQSHRDKQAERTARAICIFNDKVGILTDDKTIEIANFKNDYSFCGVHLDELTNILCTKIRELSHEEKERIVYDAHTKDSRFLADWWEEHEKIDNQRIK